MGTIEQYLRANIPQPEEEIPPKESPQAPEFKEELMHMRKVVMDASEFMATVDSVNFKELDRSAIEKILGLCNKHLRLLIEAAPFLDGNNKPITEENRIFEFYRPAEDIYGRLWRLHFRVAGFTPGDMKSTLRTDISQALNMARKSFPIWDERKKALAEVASITKGGGGTWEMGNHVTLLDFNQRSFTIGTAMQKKRKDTKKKQEEILANVKVGEALLRKLARAKRNTDGVLGKINMVWKKWLVS